MKISLIILSASVIAFIVMFIILAEVSRSGKVPDLVAGMLSKCPQTPNCVCSEYKADIRHYIAPLVIPDDRKFNPVTVLKNLIHEAGGDIKHESSNYLASTFSSNIFGFVDDLEIRVDTSQKVIHIRSASRVGYGDAGVNKKRIELIKQRYSAWLSAHKPAM